MVSLYFHVNPVLHKLTLNTATDMEYISPRFPSNSEAFASELLGNGGEFYFRWRIMNK